VLYYGQLDDHWVHFVSHEAFYVGYAELAGVATFIVLRLRRSLDTADVN